MGGKQKREVLARKPLEQIMIYYLVRELN